MKKYILVEWPESQEFMEMEGVVLANDESFGSSAYFVPEEIYVEFMEKVD